MNSQQLYLRLLRYVRPYTRIFALAIIGTAAAAATEPMIPALIQPLLDGSFVNKDPHSIGLIPLLLVTVFMVRGVADFVGKLAMEWIAHRVVMDLRNALFARLLTLPTRYFDDHSAGNLLSRLTYDRSTLVVAPQLTAVSNTTVVSESMENNKKIVRFAESITMSTYLVAFIVGRLEATKLVYVGKTPLRLWTILASSHLPHSGKISR